MSDLPREAQLEYVVYEPALASLVDDASEDPIAATRDGFVDAPRAACLSADEAMRAEARARALAEPSWSAAALTVSATLPNGATGELELSGDDQILQQLTALYGILGWPGVAAGVAAVDADAARHAKDLDAARWSEAARRVHAARETVAAAVVGALEAIERRAGEIVLDRLNRTRDFAAACWARYGAVRGQEMVDSLWKGGEFVPTYVLSDQAARGGLHAALVPIMTLRREVSLRWLAAYVPEAPERLSDIPADSAADTLEALRDAERRLDEAIADAARGPHPLAAALAHAMSWLAYDEEHMGRVAGEFLDIVRVQTEKWAAAPPVSAVVALRGKEAWADVIARGPETALVARLGDPVIQLEPLASPQVLAAAGRALRRDGDLMSSVVLVHLQAALAVAEAERHGAEMVKAIVSGAAAVVAVAINLAALAYPGLRPAAGLLDTAVTGYGALEAVRAALEMDAVRGSAVEREVAQAEQRDLHRLGRAVTEYLQTSGVVPALIQAGIPLASLESAVAHAGSRLHWLDAADLLLTLAGP